MSIDEAQWQQGLEVFDKVFFDKVCPHETVGTQIAQGFNFNGF
mgnify:CR=1 FL=1